MNFLPKNGWIGLKLHQFLNNKSYAITNNKIAQFLQIIDIYTSSFDSCEFFVSDTKNYILALLDKRSKFFNDKLNNNKIKNMKGGIISIRNYNFEYLKRTKAFVLRIYEFDYYGGEGDKINSPTDINNSLAIRLILQSNLFEFKRHEMKALISKNNNLSPVKRIKLPTETQKIVEVVDKKTTSDCSQLFDLSLKDFALSPPAFCGSFDDFSFVEKNWEKKNYFDSLKCTLKHPFDVLALLQESENDEELVFEFVFEYFKLFIKPKSFFITRDILELTDSQICTKICKLITGNFTQEKFCEVLIILQNSYVKEIKDRFFFFVHLKLIFIRLALGRTKSKLVYNLFKQVTLEFHCEIGPMHNNYCSLQSKDRLAITTKKYNPLSECISKSPSEHLNALTNKKIKLNEIKLSKKMMKNDQNSPLKVNISTVGSVFKENKQEMEVFNTQETMISTITSSMFVDSPKKDVRQITNYSHSIDFLQFQTDSQKTNSTKSSSEFLELQNKQVSDIQEFVKCTSLDLALMIIDDLRNFKPAKRR